MSNSALDDLIVSLVGDASPSLGTKQTLIDPENITDVTPTKGTPFRTSTLYQETNTISPVKFGPAASTRASRSSARDHERYKMRDPGHRALSVAPTTVLLDITPTVRSTLLFCFFLSLSMSMFACSHMSLGKSS